MHLYFRRARKVFSSEDDVEDENETDNESEVVVLSSANEEEEEEEKEKSETKESEQKKETGKGKKKKPKKNEVCTFLTYTHDLMQLEKLHFSLADESANIKTFESP